MRTLRLLASGLGAALLAVACQAPPLSGLFEPGEAFAVVTLRFET